jgi:pSer/pThr/pTyr-binding forkhead associated (FHA) protein
MRKRRIYLQLNPLMTQLTLTIMSGVEDGKTLVLDADDGDGQRDDGGWLLTIGRQDNRAIRLQKDTYISREHAELRLIGEQWYLDDCGSKNGTFVEIEGDEIRVQSTVALAAGQLFKIGRTWLRVEPPIAEVEEED